LNGIFHKSVDKWMIIVDGQVRVELRDDTGVFSISLDSDDEYDYADDNGITAHFMMSSCPQSAFIV